MGDKELQQILQEHLNLDGYLYSLTGDGAISLTKDNCKILIGYIKYPGSVHLRHSVSGYKSFCEVEDILEKYYIKYNIEYLLNTIHHVSRRDITMSQVEISKPEDIEKVLPTLKAMVYEDILPFFEEYSNIGKVYTYIESIEKSEVSKFLYHPPLPRMMILKRLENTEDWQSFSEWAVDVYTKMVSGPNGFQHEKVNSFIKELHEELVEMDYPA